MEKINSETDLRNAILQLESKRAGEGKMLREQFHLAYESIRPINLIKNTFAEAAASRDLKDNLLNTAVGLTAGYLSKALFEGEKSSPLKRLLGTAIMFGITNVVAKNPETVKKLGVKLWEMVSGALGGKANEDANKEIGETAPLS